MGVLLTSQNVFCQDQTPIGSSISIEVVDYPEITVFSLKKEIGDFSKEIPQLIQTSMEELIKKGGKPAGPPILLYYLENADLSQPVEKMMVEAAWPVDNDQFANATLPKIKAARVMYKGPYQGLNEIYSSIFAWISQNDYKVNYPTREINYNDPTTTPAEDLLTEIIIPIEEKNKE